MSKTILITGATDGIGRLTAQRLAALGHTLLVHGRNPAKLGALTAELEGQPHPYVADLSRLADVEAMAAQIRDHHPQLDVLINNAGVLKTSAPTTPEGLDVRFVVNTVAPYVLTQRLLPIVGNTGRIINLSSAAQAPVDPEAMAGRVSLSDMEAYAQSKLAITVWTRELAQQRPSGPVFVSVNPGSLLATKMVKEGFGVPGSDVGVGAEILIRAALEPSFAEESGRYFDNDAGRFADPHPWASTSGAGDTVVRATEACVAFLSSYDEAAG